MVGIDFSIYIRNTNYFFMNNERKPHQQDQESKPQHSSAETGNVGEENVQISLPRIDRPEGPFEHSGEVAGWTKEEAEEKEQQADDAQQA